MSYTHFGRFRTTHHFRRVAVASIKPVSSRVIAMRKTVAGPVSAFVDSMFNFPLIFIKNMIQSDGFPILKEQLIKKEVTPFQFGKMAYSGFGSFYTGYAGSMGVSHFLNHQLSSFFKDPMHVNTRPSFIDYAIPVVSAGIAGWGIVTPTEVLMFKQQAAASQRQAMGLMPLAKQLFYTSGIRGFFQSAQLTTVREGAFGATVFLPPVVQRHFESHDMHKWVAFFASNVVVSTVSATLSNPVDALTTRYRQVSLNTPLMPWLVKELGGNMRGLMTKGLGTRTLMYFNGAVVLNLVRPLVEGRSVHH